MGGLQCPPVPRAALEEVPSVLCCRGRGKGAGSSAHQASMDTKQTHFSLFSYKSAIYMLGWLRQQIPNRSRSAQAELPCSGFTPCTEAASIGGGIWEAMEQHISPMPWGVSAGKRAEGALPATGKELGRLCSTRGLAAIASALAQGRQQQHRDRVHPWGH